MKHKQKSLEARNAVLEKLVDLESCQSGSARSITPVAVRSSATSPDKVMHACHICAVQAASVRPHLTYADVSTAGTSKVGCYSPVSQQLL